jgi:hypothetical protein
MTSESDTLCKKLDVIEISDKEAPPASEEYFSDDFDDYDDEYDDFVGG